MLCARPLAASLRTSLCDTSAVFVLTPRQAGKSTLARGLGPRYTYVSFDNAALVPLDDASECLPRDELHHLRKGHLAQVHASPWVGQTREHRKTADQNSNLRHPRITCNPR